MEKPNHNVNGRGEAVREELLSLARKYDLKSIVEILQGMPASIILNIGFVGEFSSGKSSLINAMLGRKVLPAMDMPTTASITEVVPRESATSLEYFKRSGGDVPEKISALDFSEIATGRQPGVAIIHVPVSGVLKEGYQLIDTPGISSLDQTHADITYGYLPFLDGAVLCIDVNNGAMSESVMRFLRRGEIKPILGRLMVALGKADSKPDGGAAVRAQVVRQFAETLAAGADAESASGRVVTVSPKRVLDDRDEAPIAEFVQAFRRLYVQPKEALLRQREEKQVRETGGEVVELLHEIRSGLDLDREGFRKREEEVECEIKAIEEQKQKEHDRLAAFVRDLREAMLAVGERYRLVLETAREATLGEACQALSRDLTETAQGRMQRFVRDATVPDLSGVGEAVKARIGRVLAAVEFSKTAATALVVAAVSGGASLAAEAGEAAAGAGAREAGRSAAKVVAGAGEARGKQILKNALGALGQALERVNPINYLGDLVGDLIKAQQVKPLIDRLVLSTVDSLRGQIELTLADEVFAPLERQMCEHREALRRTWQERQQAEEALRARRSELERDIAEISKVLGTSA